MTVFKLLYIDSFRDSKTGKRVFYFRRPRGPRVRLPDDPNSREFREAYEIALEGSHVRGKVRASTRTPGTFDWLIEKYLESMSFARKAKSTQYASRLAIERYIRDDDLGHRRFCDLRRDHVEKMMTKRASTPGAANDLVKKIRSLMNFAIQNGWIDKDPTAGIEKFKAGEHHTWTEEEIAQFEEQWPVGTRERTAFALFLYTGQRLGDVCEMVWADIEQNAKVRVAQNKTKAKLTIPLHSELRAALSATPKEHVSILTTNFGRPFTDKGFGNWMADRIAMAGLPDRCVTHGLRKAASRRMAEAGCTTKEIMAITGHRTSRMVDLYTKDAEQEGMAISAMERLEKQTSNKKSQAERQNLEQNVKTLTKTNVF
ncbi:MAG: tyrosine-type recombinase/integrase [Roseiarcus sp.]|jgi:integrase